MICVGAGLVTNLSAATMNRRWHLFYFTYPILILFGSKCDIVDAASCPPSPQSPRSTTRLRQNLFCDYDRLSRPVKNWNDTVPLHLSFEVHRINMETDQQTMDVDGVLRFIWVDQYLVWMPWQYDGIAYLKVEDAEVWAPDLTLNLMSMNGVVQLTPSACVVAYSGRVICMLEITLRAPCMQDMRHWPYDKHNCTFSISSLMYHEQQLNLTQLEVYTGGVSQNRIWELKSLSSLRHRVNITSTSTATYYPYIETSFIVQRHAAFFAAATVLPGCVMLLLILSTFWMRSMSTTRIQIGGFIILGCITFLSYLLYLIPANGENVPVIVTIFRDCLALAAFSMVMASIAKMLDESQSRPPPIVASLINWIELSVVGRLLLITGSATAHDDETAIVESSSSKLSPWTTFTILLDRLAFLVSLLVTIVLVCGYIP